MKYKFFLFFFTFIGLNISAESSDLFLILDFELEDYAKIEQSPDEKKALNELKISLANTLIQKEYKARAASLKDWNEANRSVGYLFNRPESAKKIGEKYDADYVIIGKVSKPSNLFVYLMIRILDVKKEKPVADYKIELKGQWTRLTDRGIKKLAQKISDNF